MVTQVGRRWVGSQREGLLQTAQTGVLPAGEGQELVHGALARAAGIIFMTQTGRQAVWVAGPAAGEARVNPVSGGLAGEGSRLAKPSR